jgi:DTW domain-containing protein YfiP
VNESTVSQNRQQHRLFTGREVCERCLRPKGACYCGHIRPIDTKTRLVLLQHPRERYVAIGTARMANLCLTNSELHIGIDWSRSEPLARALADAARPPILLYPGPGAIDIARQPPPGPVTLVVIDGTWAQTKKVLRTNPVLAALPRYAFVPETPSEYRIRKEPDAVSVATIEALVHALTALEGEGIGCTTLLDPFRAMVDFQIECQGRFQAGRSRHAKRRGRVRRMRVPRVLSERPGDLLCVAAEANSWPYTMRARHPDAADELVQWAAHRPSTGETLSFVVAPRGELAPGTALHTGLDEAVIHAGGSLEELHERWRAFVKDTDVICSWGHYETKLFTSAGGVLPPSRLDLRHVARDVNRGRVGSLADFRATVDSAPPEGGAPPRIAGRAGRKLRAIADILDAFGRIAASSPDAAQATP